MLSTLLSEFSLCLENYSVILNFQCGQIIEVSNVVIASMHYGLCTTYRIV